MSTPLRTDAFMRKALDTWGDAVYRLALSQARSAADAQDIAQEVFIRLLESTVAFESDAHLKAWLLRVTVNRCRDLQRSVWQMRVDSLDESPSSEHGGGTSCCPELPGADRTPEDKAVTALTRNPVWDALELLSPDQQLTMHLRYVEECDEAQIARIMGVQRTTVRTRLHRARKRLRKLLEEHAAARMENGALQTTAGKPADSTPYAPRPPNTATASRTTAQTRDQIP